MAVEELRISLATSVMARFLEAEAILVAANHTRKTNCIGQIVDMLKYAIQLYVVVGFLLLDDISFYYAKSCLIIVPMDLG